MSTSRYNRRDFMKVAAPAAIAVTQGIAPARSNEPPDAHPEIYACLLQRRRMGVRQRCS
jgi:hypothetical protein